jgi:hypothetical protein
MKSNTTLQAATLGIFVLIAGLTIPTTAQEQAQPGSAAAPRNEKMADAPDEIFNQIMNTLSLENRARIDSAGHVPATPQTATEATGQKTDANANRQARAQQQRADHLDKLPAELRSQVEKTIQEIDKQREERNIELKELNRRQ